MRLCNRIVSLDDNVWLHIPLTGPPSGKWKNWPPLKIIGLSGDTAGGKSTGNAI